MPEEISNDKEFILQAIKLNSLSIVSSKHVHIVSDKEFMLEAVMNNGYALNYASDEVKQDPEIVMEALKCNGFVLKYSDELYQSRMHHCYHDAYLGMTMSLR